METEKIEVISPDMFEFTQLDEKIFDTKFETKAVGYFGDAFRRFCKNKSSVVAFFILLLIILLAIFAPMVSKYDPTVLDTDGALLPSRIPGLEKLGIFDGCKKFEHVSLDYVKSITDPFLETIPAEEYSKYKFVEYIVGVDSMEELEAQAYTEEIRGEMKKFVDFKYNLYKHYQAPKWVQGRTHAEYLAYKEQGAIVLDAEGKEMIVIDKSAAGILNQRPDLIPEGQTVEDFYVYKIYIDPVVANGGKEVYHYFGTDHTGRDLWTRIWVGARLSLLIGLFVAIVSISVGVVWGAISGYYGGAVDMAMERFVEVLTGIPWIVLMIIIKMLLRGKVDDTFIVAISLVLTSWTGTAGMVRSQMYRYKNREYVLASRTLGSNDFRLISKHILPNALGTIVTGSVLVIPSAIFFESSVAYLGLGVNSSTISIGNLLNQGRDAGIVENPYLTLWPALVISLLMISFNMFGNGLRDALNPSLRGAE